MKTGDIIRLTGLYVEAKATVKSYVTEESSSLARRQRAAFSTSRHFQRGLSAASVHLLIISELISDVALAFTTGTGDVNGAGGAASQPVSVAPAALS